jgi:hypothetical protein
MAVPFSPECELDTFRVRHVAGYLRCERASERRIVDLGRERVSFRGEWHAVHDIDEASGLRFSLP